MNDSRVFIFDVYNSGIYPRDHVAKEAINCRIELKHYTSDDDYLHLIEKLVTLFHEYFNIFINCKNLIYCKNL